MGKGKLGPDGYVMDSREKTATGTAQDVNAVNNKLVKENGLLRDQIENLMGEVATLTAELEQATGTDMPTRIAAALESLDPKDKSAWTDAGLPKVEAICQIVENNEVTRADIEAALPGFERPKDTD